MKSNINIDDTNKWWETTSPIYDVFGSVVTGEAFLQSSSKFVDPEDSPHSSRPQHFFTSTLIMCDEEFCV